MHTMHPVLPIGPYDWAEDALPVAEFEARVGAARKIMMKNDWAGVAIFGDIPECGLLSYFTNYTPKLAWGMVLIPQEGPLRILSGDGGRMVPAGKLLTWVEDVRPTRDLGESVAEWVGELPAGDGRNRSAIGTVEFEIMPNALHDQLTSGTPEGVTLVESTDQIQALTRHKSAREIALINDNCEVLSNATAAFHDSFIGGNEISTCVLEAEAAARAGGAQDTRALFSTDGGHTLVPFQELSAAAVDRAYAYLAIKRRGYWVEGLLSAGDDDIPVRTSAADALTRVIAGASAGGNYDTLLQAADSPQDAFSHPFIGARIGNGIGVSLAEGPLLEAGSSDQLNDDGVYSFRIGLTNSGGDTALVSAMVHVTPGGPNILWSSL